MTWYQLDDGEQGPLLTTYAQTHGWEPTTLWQKFHEVNRVITSSPTLYWLGLSPDYYANLANSENTSFSPFKFCKNASQPLVNAHTVAKNTRTVGGRCITNPIWKKENYNWCQYYSPVVPRIIIGNHQFDPKVTYFDKTTTWSHLLSNVSNIIVSISYSTVLDDFFSVAIAANPHWKMKPVVNHLNTCETTTILILGATKFYLHFSIFIFRRPIHVVDHLTPTTILRLSPIIDQCIMDYSHSKIIPHKACIALNLPCNFPGVMLIRPKGGIYPTCRQYLTSSPPVGWLDEGSRRRHYGR